MDACLSGIGGSDTHRAYAGQVAPLHDDAANITELEAINVVVALHTFLSSDDTATHVQIHCDNMAAVQVLQSGRGRNRLLLECARAAWMVQAILDVHLSYVHIPGSDNQVADCLSRAHLSPLHHAQAAKTIDECTLVMNAPCLHIFENICVPVLSRSGHAIVTGQSCHDTTKCKSTGHVGKPGINGTDIRRVCTAGTVRPLVPHPPYDVRIHGILGATHPGSCDNKEQDVPCKDISPDGRRSNTRSRSPPCRPSIGWAPTEQELCPKHQGCNQHGPTTQGPLLHPTNNNRGRGGSRNTPYVLRCTPPIRGGTTDHQQVRPHAAPYTERHRVQSELTKDACKVGKEHAEGRPVTIYNTKGPAGPSPLPSTCFKGAFRPHPQSLFYRPTAPVPNHRRPYPAVSDQVGMGYGPKKRPG